MKINFHFKIKNLVIYAAVALFSSTSLTGCFSSGDGEAPNAEVNNSGNEASTNANATETNANPAVANGETPPAADGNLALNNGEATTPTNTAPTGNTAGDELNNLVTDGSANAATTPADPAADPSAAGADPFAAPPADATASLTPPTNPSTDLGASAAPADASAPPPAEDPFAPPPSEPVASTATAETAASEPVPAAATDSAPAATTDPAAPPAESVPVAATTDPAAATESVPAATTDPAAPATESAPATTSEPVAATSEPASSTAEAPKASGKKVTEDRDVETQSVAMPSNGLLPEKGSKMVYYVQTGDTLAKIAGRIYGNAGKWKTLAEENKLEDPSLIYAGDAIFYTLDDNSTNFAQKYESSPRQSVTVSKGDTLSGIAAKVLGSSAEWRTLWKSNPHVPNPDVLVIGTVLSFRAIESVASVE